MCNCLYKITWVSNVGHKKTNQSTASAFHLSEYFKNLLLLSNYHNMFLSSIILGMTAVCPWNICDNVPTQTCSALTRVVSNQTSCSLKEHSINFTQSLLITRSLWTAVCPLRLWRSFPKSALMPHSCHIQVIVLKELLACKSHQRPSGNYNWERFLKALMYPT